MNPLEFLRDVLAQFSTAPIWTQLLTKVTLLLAVAWVVHFSLARANPRWRTLCGVALRSAWCSWPFGCHVAGTGNSHPAPEPVATTALPCQPMDAERAAGDSRCRCKPETGPGFRRNDDATHHQTQVETRPEAARPIESPGPLSWRMALPGIWGSAWHCCGPAGDCTRQSREDAADCQAASEEIVRGRANRRPRWVAVEP